MVWPTSDVNTGNADAGTDNPATFRTDVLDLLTKFNQLRNHVSTLGQTILGRTTAAQVRADLGAQPIPTETSGTTAGTGTAYTFAPTTPITAYTTHLSFWVKFHVVSGANPTLQISGLATPPALVRYTPAGVLVNIAAGELPAGFATRVTLLSTTQALVEEMPPSNDLLSTTRIDIASASTVNLTTGAPNTRHINITGTTAITAFTVAAGLVYFVRFNASLTLTNSASLITQTGANVTTRAGDTCILRATAANTVEVLSYARAARPTLGTSVATTSGTAVDFTAIPSWATRITLMLNGISTSGSSSVVVQLGTAGGVEVSGYATATSLITSTAVSTTTTSGGFAVTATGAQVPASVLNGVLEFTLISGNTWMCRGSVARTDATFMNLVAGAKDLAGTLDRIRITTLGGIDPLDGGLANILFE